MPSVLLFSGLPLDVREPDLAELLVADPVRLVPSSVAVTALHNGAGSFLGTFLVEVGSDADAERVRKQFSGQLIDGSYTLSVHHVLPATHPHPSITPPAPITSRVTPMQTQQPKKQPQSVPKKPAAVKKDDAKAPGLKLLSRLGKGGKAGEQQRQKLLLEKQRAALKKKGSPGDVLASRLGKSKPSATKAKTAAAKKAASKPSSGGAKIARAKIGKMDVDTPPSSKGKQKEKARPKSQAELDEEMRTYERQRRFANA